MKAFICTQDCFDEHGHLWKVGMERRVEDHYWSGSLDSHFSPIGTVNEIPKPSKEALNDSVAAYAKRHKISEDKMTELFGTKKMAPHEKVAILAKFIEGIKE